MNDSQYWRGSGRAWTTEEDAFLLRNHSHFDHRLIAARLNRTTEAIKGRLKRLRRRGNGTA